jgi:hypothetical protein
MIGLCPFCKSPNIVLWREEVVMCSQIDFAEDGLINWIDKEIVESVDNLYFECEDCEVIFADPEIMQEGSE